MNSLAWTGWSYTFPVRQGKHKESVGVSQALCVLFPEGLNMESTPLLT